MFFNKCFFCCHIVFVPKSKKNSFFSEKEDIGIMDMTVKELFINVQTELIKDQNANQEV